MIILIFNFWTKNISCIRLIILILRYCEYVISYRLIQFVAAPSVSRTDRVVPLRGHAKVMAQTMTASLKIPHFGYCDEVRMDGLMELRKRMKHLAEEKGVKLSYLPFMIKAASMGLKKYPVLNSSINESLTEITYKVRIFWFDLILKFQLLIIIRLHITSVSPLIPPTAS